MKKWIGLIKRRRDEPPPTLPHLDRHFQVAWATAGVERNKLLGELLHRRSCDADKLIVEIGNGLAKWVLTSLLAVNAGALVAVAGLSVDPGAKIAAGIAFVIGIIGALLSGHLQVRIIRKLMEGTALSILYWQTVQIDGQRDGDAERELDTFTSAANRSLRWPIGVGFASIISFAAGCAAIAVALYS